MKRLSGSIWSTIVNGILATCAVLVTTLTIRSEIVRSRTTSMGQSSTPFFETQTDWKQYFTHGRRVGPAGAGLSLVIFSDYQCPACRKLSEQLRQYQKDSAYQFAILYRHWPLPQHRFALQAALASECAAFQGRFEQMHHLLFADQESLGVIPWVRLAADAGVSDLKDFERCLSSDLVRNAVQADAAAAKQLGARGTPAVIVVGGAQFAGVPSKKVMDSLLLAVSSKIKNATTK